LPAAASARITNISARADKEAPHPDPLPACGEREAPAKREGEGLS
jgi:hypothetical protein